MERLKTGGGSVLGIGGLSLSSFLSRVCPEVWHQLQAALLSSISEKNTVVLARGSDRAGPCGSEGAGESPRWESWRQGCPASRDESLWRPELHMRATQPDHTTEALRTWWGYKPLKTGRPAASLSAKKTALLCPSFHNRACSTSNVKRRRR